MTPLLDTGLGDLIVDAERAATAAESARWGDDSGPDRQSGTALASIALSMSVLARIELDRRADEIRWKGTIRERTGTELVDAVAAEKRNRNPLDAPPHVRTSPDPARLCEWELATGVRCAAPQPEHDGFIHPFTPDVIEGSAPPANPADRRPDNDGEVRWVHNGVEISEAEAARIQDEPF